MIVVMGGTGHVGSQVAQALLQLGQSVTIVARRARDAAAWRAKGVPVAEVDVADVDALRAALRRGRRAFLLNPPADPASDTDAVERASVAHLLAALAGSGLDKVVAESTFGARPGDRIGDLSVLWTLEQGLQSQPIPAAINRGAYYMSNWDALLDGVRESGTLPTMFPPDLRLPMVAPEDLGRAAAARLLSPAEDVGVRRVEGPDRYSPADVARAFGRALGRPVEVVVAPRGEWRAAYRKLGFSDAAADAFARMTAVIVDDGFPPATESIRGTTTLDAYIQALVDRP